MAKMHYDLIESFVRSEIKSRLRNGPVKISFTKADGTTRNMTATLQEGVAQFPEGESKNPVHDGVQRVWDVDNGVWRSFRWDRLISYSL